MIIMVQQVAHAISSFVVGTYLDRGNARPVLAVGVFFVGFSNFGFSGKYMLDPEKSKNKNQVATRTGSNTSPHFFALKIPMSQQT